MAREKIFTFSLSVMDDIADSVLQTGSIKDGTHKSIYFSHYERALEYLKHQCEEFVKGGTNET